MGILPGIQAAEAEITEWRRYLHSIPELGFEEHRTSAFVREQLSEWGIPFEVMAGTGVVATLKKGNSDRSIGIRADMDALPMQEETGLAWQSTTPGRMHACGHDGHTTMLLAAARHLARSGRFNGSVHFIFQPAEEGLTGAKTMIGQGLFERFPCKRIFGAHNDPLMPLGRISAVKGAIMAAADRIRIHVSGHSGHAARPHHTIDPIIVAAHLAVGLQTLVSRRIDALDSAVISLTQFHSGSADNVIPDRAVMSGTVRTLRPATRERVKQLLTALIEATATAHGTSATLELIKGSPAVVNETASTDVATVVAIETVGEGNVLIDCPPSMGAEDFAFMGQKVPSCFLRVGTAENKRDPFPLHSSKFDFNDAALPVGASLWVNLVEACL
ncbi:M20 aminoacylase family protein [Pseudochelatococcus sp. B33]